MAHALANAAMDLEVNDDAKEAGLTLPEGGFLPGPLGLPEGLTAEEYALRLLELARKRAEGGGGGGGASGDGDEEEDGGSGGGASGDGDEDEDEAGGSGSGEREGEEGGAGEGGDFLEALGKILRQGARDVLTRALARAMEEAHPELKEVGMSEAGAQVAIRQTAEEILAQASKLPGTVPLGILRAAEAVLRPKVDWRSVLRQRVRKAVMDLSDRAYPTYSKPHRRQGALGRVVLPGGYGTKPEVAVVVDTSGSMGDLELAQALAEVKGVLQGRRATVYSVDAEVHAVQRVWAAEQVRLLGGGGTDMGRGIEAALRDGHHLVVVLTDGYTPWPERPPKATVVVGLLHPEGEEPPETPPWTRTVPIPVKAR